jgi:hypothetical protein
MKQFVSWFTHGVAGGAALRKAVYESRTEQQILERVEAFFESLLAQPAGLDCHMVGSNADQVLSKHRLL